MATTTIPDFVSRVDPRQRATAAAVHAADAAYRAQRDDGIALALERVSPFVRRARAGLLPVADFTGRIGGRS